MLPRRPPASLSMALVAIESTPAASLSKRIPCALLLSPCPPSLSASSFSAWLCTLCNEFLRERHSDPSAREGTSAEYSEAWLDMPEFMSSPSGGTSTVAEITRLRYRVLRAGNDQEV